MSCWVAPSVAAELWGISVGQILCSIQDGSIVARYEYGFTFVDSGILPQASQTPAQLSPADRPATFVSPDSANSDAPQAMPYELRPIVSDTDDTSDPEGAADIEGSPDHHDEPSIVLNDWRQVRRDTQRLRRPPLAA